MKLEYWIYCSDLKVIGCSEEKRSFLKPPAVVSAFSYVAMENPSPGT
jgi:hypothetical protein